MTPKHEFEHDVKLDVEAEEAKVRTPVAIIETT